MDVDDRKPSSRPRLEPPAAAALLGAAAAGAATPHIVSFFSLPEDTLPTIARSLGEARSLYHLACTHRELIKWARYAQRLEKLTPMRLKPLITYLRREADEGKVALPELTHLHFASEFVFYYPPSREEMANMRDMLNPHDMVDLADPERVVKLFKGLLLREGCMPKLESVDMSECMMDQGMCARVLEGLVGKQHLSKLYLPHMPLDMTPGNQEVAVPMGGGLEVQPISAESQAFKTAFLALRHLREVGNKHGTACAALEALLSDHFPAWPVSMETLDFMRAYANHTQVDANPHAYRRLFAATVHLLTAVCLLEMNGPRRLRVLRMEGPPQAGGPVGHAITQMTQLSMIGFGMGLQQRSLGHLTELSLRHHFRLTPQILQGLGNHLRAAQAPLYEDVNAPPAAGGSGEAVPEQHKPQELRILRLHGFMYNFESATSFLQAAFHPWPMPADNQEEQEEEQGGGGGGAGGNQERCPPRRVLFRIGPRGAYVNLSSPPWQSLEVLDLTDCLLGDIGMEHLATGIATGCFGPYLRELDLSLGAHLERTPQNTVGPAGLRALVVSLNSRGGKVRLKKLKLGGQRIGDDGVLELAQGWKSRQGGDDEEEEEEGSEGGEGEEGRKKEDKHAQAAELPYCCWENLEELKLNDNNLTDLTLIYMLDAEWIVANVKLYEAAAAQGVPYRKSVLQRLVLERNNIVGVQQLSTYKASTHPSTLPSSPSSSLQQLNIALNPMTAGGLERVLLLLGHHLQELKLGGYENEPATNDESVSKLLGLAMKSPSSVAAAAAAATNTNTTTSSFRPILTDLRRLDMRRLPVTRQTVEGFMHHLAQSNLMPRLCQLECTVADVRKREDQEGLLEELKEARKPHTWDVLTLNKRFYT